MKREKNILLFGRRSSGKSSLLNIISDENIPVDSGIPEANPVFIIRSTEIPEIGRIRLFDPTIIAESENINIHAIKLLKKEFGQIDLVLLLYTNNRFGSFEKSLMKYFEDEKVPVIILHTQSDIIEMDKSAALEISTNYRTDVLEFSCNLLDDAEQTASIDTLKELIAKNIQRK